MAVSFLRTALLYTLIIITIRLMGKRQLGQLEPSELVVTILISELAAVPMQDPEVPLLYGVIPMIVLLAMEVLVSALTMKSIRLRTLLCGKPNILIGDGKIQQDALMKSRINVDELIEELRLRGIMDLNEVQYAILETNGQMSVIQRSFAMPVTKKDYGLPPEQRTLPISIVSDGRLMRENLSLAGRDERWLADTLAAHGIESIREVFWLSVEQDGTVVLIRREECVE